MNTRPLILLDTGPTQWPIALNDFDGCATGQLLTPLTSYNLIDPSRPWAIDNGGFKRQRPEALTRLLDREKDRRQACLFVTMPDVVCNGRRTLELFRHFVDQPMMAGWRRALVLQNGVEDLDIPWNRIDAVFVGGDDAFKESTAAADCAKTARWLGKHVHVGRVNTPERIERIVQHWPELDSIGWAEHGIDSIDGSGISRYSHMRRKVRDCILGIGQTAEAVEDSDQLGLFETEAA